MQYSHVFTNSQIHEFGMFLIDLFCILLSFSVHEFSHAWAAEKLGDNTAKDSGRLTLNPLSHFDLVGMLMFMFFGFGWARPVPIKSSNLRGNYKKSLALITIAGPISNFALAFISMFSFKVLNLFMELRLSDSILGIFKIIYSLLLKLSELNIALGVFNLIPIPPLDGSKLLSLIFNSSRTPGFFEQHGRIILFILLQFSFFHRFLVTGSNLVYNFFNNILSFI